MRFHFTKKLLIILICFYLPLRSMAWGVLGHRIVGEIADSYLSADARKAIKDLLGTESIAIASNWMDFIKSDPNYNYLSNWHYINIKGAVPQNEFYDFLDRDTAINIYTRINFAAKELRNKVLAHDTRAMYLRILIHLVGDAHQPMHIGRPEDLGGNKIKLMWFNDNVNLHQVWDERMVNFQQLSYTEYANMLNHTTKAQRKTWQNEPVKQWMWDAYQLAEKIYSDIKPDDKLSYNYNFKYISTMNGQLLKGGVHLAGLLNSIFED
jgi:hypothetical protein